MLRTYKRNLKRISIIDASRFQGSFIVRGEFYPRELAQMTFQQYTYILEMLSLIYLLNGGRFLSVKMNPCQGARLRIYPLYFINMISEGKKFSFLKSDKKKVHE